MLKTVHLASPRNKHDHALTQRDILHTVQQCPKIMKEDKLFIRNKIKDIFKQLNSNGNNFQLHQNQWPVVQQSDSMELLQIFSQCNRPLNRIHMYENHSHWLQVKLRKYITNQKKKQKDQCLNQFKRQKCVQKSSKCRMQKKFKQQKSLQKNIHRDHNKFKQFLHGRDSEMKSYTSQQIGRSCSPKPLPFKQQHNHQMRNKHLSGTLSPSFERISKIGSQTCKNMKQSYNNNKNWNFNKNMNTNNGKQKLHTAGSLIKSKQNTNINILPTNSYKIKTQIQKQNSKNSRNIGQSVVNGSQSNRQQYIQQIITNKNTKNNYQNSVVSSSSKNAKNSNIFSYQYQLKNQHNNNFSPQLSKNENESSNKNKNKSSTIINNLLKIQQFSTIKENNNQRKSNTNNINLQSISIFPGDRKNQNLFTSPELLEQCRKFLKNTTQHDQIKNKSIQSSIQMQTGSNLKSINIFQQIQCPAPQFRFYPEVSKFKDIKQLLRHIFNKDWTAYISSSQKQQIIARCPIGYEQSVKSLLSEIDSKTNFISFLQIFPIIKNSFKLNFAFSNIFLLLDVDNKGIVTHSDYQTFMENFNNCPIEEHVLHQLRDRLAKFQQCLGEIFKGQEIMQGCFEYLELIERPEIYQLGEILQIFQFQIDSACNTQGNNQIQ